MRTFFACLRCFVTIPALAGAVLGCAGGVDDEPLGTALERALTANALTANALTANALTANALTADALDPGAMNTAARSAIEDPSASGNLARMLLRYEVSCAFRSDQSFAFTWVDASGSVHAESYPGALGLAPYWANGPLDAAGQGWVSACLAARVNAQGISVPLSARGSNSALATTSAEAAAYPVREGAFFGQLFGPSPAVYACYDPASSTFATFAHRYCAQTALTLIANGYATAPACGPIQVVGPCVDVLNLLSVGPCASENATWHYFNGCVPPGTGASIPAITTFLQQSPL